MHNIFLSNKIELLKAKILKLEIIIKSALY